jgi:hypothetical protein
MRYRLADSGDQPACPGAAGAAPARYAGLRHRIARVTPATVDGA